MIDPDCFIGVAGGLDESPLESPLFVFEFVAIVVAFASLGVAVMTERLLGFKVIGGMRGVLIGFGLSILASVVAAAVNPSQQAGFKRRPGSGSRRSSRSA